MSSCGIAIDVGSILSSMGNLGAGKIWNGFLENSISVQLVLSGTLLWRLFCCRQREGCGATKGVLQLFGYIIVAS